jgi:hypothetical protein
MYCRIVQAEETEVDFDLFERLSEILAAETGIHILDTREMVRHAFGLFLVDERYVDRVSSRFKEAGLPNYVLKEEELVAVPPAWPVFPSVTMKRKFEPRLICAGVISTVKNKTMGMISTAGGIDPDADRAYREGGLAGVLELGRQEDTLPTPTGAIVMAKQIDVFSVDAVSAERHYQISDESVWAGEQRWLRTLLESRPDVYVSRSARIILDGRRNLKRFDSRKNYDKHVCWLMQLAFRTGASAE